MQRSGFASGLKPKGFTLLEVVVASAILFLVSVYVMQLFGTSLGVPRRSSQIFTTATFLAQQTMEQTLYQKNIQSGAAVTSPFTGSFTGYTSTFSSTPFFWDSNFSVITVDVTGPHGELSKLVSLVKAPFRLMGISTDEHNATVTFAANPGLSSITRFTWPSSSTPSLESPPRPTSFFPGGIATDENAQNAWLGDIAGQKIYYYNYFAGPDWCHGTWTDFTPTNGRLGVPFGLASSRDATNSGTVFVADDQNQFWTGTFPNLLPGDAPGWQAPYTNAGFQQLVGLASDDYGKTVWITDRKANCLYFYDNNQSWPNGLYTTNGNPNGPPVCLSPSQEVGQTWKFIKPMGVSVPSNLEAVYVVDNQGIWEFNWSDTHNPKTSTNWIQPTGTASNPPTLMNGQVVPSGLSVSSDGNVFWLFNDQANPTIDYWASGAWNLASSMPAQYAACSGF